MRFNSVIYWSFLAAVAAVFWLLPARFRKYWLLGASYLFYGSWHWPYLGLLIGSAAMNWWGAKWIALAPGDRKRRGAVILAADVVVLALFKYLDWALGGFVSLFALFGVESPFVPPHWLLPLGISFYLFE